MKQEIKKAYEFNKKWWHNLYNPYSKYELHHIYGRVGILLCCPRFWRLALHGHQDNWKWVEQLKKDNREDLLTLMKNISPYANCTKELFIECEKCYFFR